MPKVKDFDRIAQYLDNQLPQVGFFSTLDEIIDNAPMEGATAQEWENYLKPGRKFTREGVEFPLKQEELNYSKVLEYLRGSLARLPGYDSTRISRKELRHAAQEHRPPLSLEVGLDIDPHRKELEIARDERFPQEFEVSWRNPPRARHANPEFRRYSYPGRKGSYEENITLAKSLGSFPLDHFNPYAISHSRLSEHGTDEGILRLVEEIQSDRHEHAAEILPFNEIPLTPQEFETYQGLLSRHAKAPPGEEGIKAHQDLVDFMTSIRKSRGRRGYSTPETRKKLSELEFLEQQNPAVTMSPGFDGDWMAKKLAQLRSKTADAPFKTPKDYGMLELRKALIDAVNRGDTFLGLTRGQDQITRYEMGMGDKQAEGMKYVYDKLYRSQLEKLARQYGAGPLEEVETNVKETLDTRPETMAASDYESMDMFLADIEETLVQSDALRRGESPSFEAIRNVPHQLGFMLDDYAQGLSDDPIARSLIANARADVRLISETAGNISRGKGNTKEAVLEFDALVSQPFRRVSKDLTALEKIWNERFFKARDSRKSFPAMRITPEVAEKVKKAGVPIWALVGALGLENLYNPEEPFAEGGEVESDSILERLGELAERHAPGESGARRKRVLSGLMSQLMNLDDEGNPQFRFGYDPMRGEWELPGLVDETLALGELLEFIGIDPPEFSKRAGENQMLLKEAIDAELGMEEPHGFKEGMEESLGVMLGQIPVPAATLKTAARELKGARELLREAGTSPVEFFMPTVQPGVTSYGSGAVFGGSINALADRLAQLAAKQESTVEPDEEVVMAKKAKGGKVGKLKGVIKGGLKDKVVDLGRQKLLKEKGLTEEDAEDMLDGMIQNQRDWVIQRKSQGHDTSKDEEWLRENDPGYEEWVKTLGISKHAKGGKVRTLLELRESLRNLPDVNVEGTGKELVPSEPSGQLPAETPVPPEIPKSTVEKPEGPKVSRRGFLSGLSSFLGSPVNLRNAALEELAKRVLKPATRKIHPLPEGMTPEEFSEHLDDILSAVRESSNPEDVPWNQVYSELSKLVGGDRVIRELRNFQDLLGGVSDIDWDEAWSGKGRIAEGIEAWKNEMDTMASNYGFKANPFPDEYDARDYNEFVTSDFNAFVPENYQIQSRKLSPEERAEKDRRGRQAQLEAFRELDAEEETIEKLLEEEDANEFFRASKGYSWDRPSAWMTYQERYGLPDPPHGELGLRELDDEEIAYLEEIFPEGIPEELLNDDWDT